VAVRVAVRATVPATVRVSVPATAGVGGRGRCRPGAYGGVAPRTPSATAADRSRSPAVCRRTSQKGGRRVWCAVGCGCRYGRCGDEGVRGREVVRAAAECGTNVPCEVAGCGSSTAGAGHVAGSVRCRGPVSCRRPARSAPAERPVWTVAVRSTAVRTTRRDTGDGVVAVGRRGRSYGRPGGLVRNTSGALRGLVGRAERRGVRSGASGRPETLLGNPLDEKGLRHGPHGSYGSPARLAQSGMERIEPVERTDRFRPRTWVSRCHS
jgi:hypothetical protein